jgi:hypothetical protein
MKRVIASAALAAIGFAGVAYAGDTTAPKVMSDSEMDRVTAGAFVDVPAATLFQEVGGGGQYFHRNADNGWSKSEHRGACFACNY